jgi:GNAT superfamily N-acetyltransferase
MATDNINFRLATIEDAVQLESLINTAFRDDKTTEVFLSVDHADINVTDVPSIKAKIAQPDCAVLVATDTDDTLMAHCSVRKLENGCVWFGVLAVNVDYQKRGLGGKVLLYAESYARREWGARRMEFDVVNTREQLIAWYTHRGYQPTGKTTPFPYDRHSGWEGILRDDLHFVIFGKDLDEAPDSTRAE